MRLTLLLLLFAFAAQADDAGFSPIFDGKTLDGWRGQDAAFWSVEDGAITGTITAQRPAPMNQYLVWQGGLVEDFEVKLEFRLTGSATPDTNSGFQFRSRRLPNGDVGGYQVDINAAAPPRAGLYDEFGRHFLAREGERSTFGADGKKSVETFALEPGARDFKLDEWHEYHLTAIGPKLSLRVNGRLIAETTDNDTDCAEPRGILALQLHTGPPMKVQFRNVRLKRSPSKATPRDVLIAEAALHWQPGERADAHQPMLKAVGEITPGIVVDGVRVARLRNAYFDAALDFNQPKAWNAPGEALTILLRARVPDGNWTTALVAKRGHHDICNFNLYGYDVAETPGPDIGFEIHTDRGFFSATFPVSKIDATAWHDLAARYDGKRLQLLCDGAVMSERPASGALTQNQEPVLLGAETEHGKPARFFTGEMAEAALWTRALDDAELAAVLRREAIVALPKAWQSPVQFRPAAGRLADTIPFFHRGEYHIFYLLADMGKVPWEHIVSRDLVQWRELPRALASDGPPASTDGENMFTGGVVERDGRWHIFYTGWNPRHPVNREHVCHATSTDGIAWTKHPEHTFTADGTHYDASRENDFRDPFVFWNEEEKQWWMLLCARAAGDKRPVTGVATSRDLVKWEQQQPLCDGYRGTPECPDIFRIGGTWYLIVSPSEGVTTYRTAPALRGPWSPAPGTPID
ncbi:MAG: family 16 glycoside hydrolase, partial [Chthoniobacteraceae bacterium]